MNDIERISALLEDIVYEARKLPWAAERPWRTKTHIWVEAQMPTIDLHDLNVRLAKKVFRAVLKEPENIEAGAVCFVTGIGKNSLGDSPLRNFAIDFLSKRAYENDWGFHPMGPGRLVLVVDPEKAPASATGALPRYFWYCVAGFIALFVFALLNKILT